MDSPCYYVVIWPIPTIPILKLTMFTLDSQCIILDNHLLLGIAQPEDVTWPHIHMPDKGWRLSNLIGAFLHLNMRKGAIQLNPRPKRPPYVVFFVLYKFCVVWIFLCFIFSFVFYAYCMMCFIALSFFNFFFSTLLKLLNFSIFVLYRRVV